MTTLDPDALKQFQFLVFSKLEGAMTAGMIHLGDQLGLYRALADADGAADLRRAGGAHRARRAVGPGVGLQPGGGQDPRRRPARPERFSLAPEGVAVLASPEHEAFGIGMFHDLPQMLAALERLPESFRNGLGFDYDSHGPGVGGRHGAQLRAVEPGPPGADRAADARRSRRQAHRRGPGRRHRLRRGRRRAAARRGLPGQPRSPATTSPASPSTAPTTRLGEAGLDNASFHDPREHPLPTDHSIDFVTTFDCIHDMTDPQGMMAAIRDALRRRRHVAARRHQGSRHVRRERRRRTRWPPLMYGISVLSCMSSALSEPGGAGLGTLGLPACRAEAMAREAGFTRFRRLPVEHAINAFYEVRP